MAQRKSLFSSSSQVPSTEKTPSGDELLLLEAIAKQNDHLKSHSDLCGALKQKIAAQDIEIAQMKEKAKEFQVTELTAEIEKLKRKLSPDTVSNWESDITLKVNQVQAEVEKSAEILASFQARSLKVDEDVMVRNKEHRRLRRALKRLQNEYCALFNGSIQKREPTPSDTDDGAFCFNPF